MCIRDRLCMTHDADAAVRVSTLDVADRSTFVTCLRAEYSFHLGVRSSATLLHFDVGMAQCLGKEQI